MQSKWGEKGGQSKWRKGATNEKKMGGKGQRKKTKMEKEEQKRKGLSQKNGQTVAII